MATSDTLAFNPSVSQCIEDAYERCNVQLTSGLSLRTALFSLNILLSEWGNRGIHFWEVANASIYINDGQASYDIYWDNTVRNSSTTNPHVQTLLLLLFIMPRMFYWRLIEVVQVPVKMILV